MGRTFERSRWTSVCYTQASFTQLDVFNYLNTGYCKYSKHNTLKILFPPLYESKRISTKRVKLLIAQFVCAQLLEEQGQRQIMLNP